MALTLATTSCATPRYVGTAVDERTFVHRGYGFVVRLDNEPEWRFATRGNDEIPWGLWPQSVSAPLDLDADGVLERDELAQHWNPDLRLLSRTSSVARVDLRVRILSQNDTAVSHILRATLDDGDARPTLTRRAVRLGFDAWIGHCPTCPAPWVAMIDHDGFVSERGSRRQLVVLELFDPPNAAWAQRALNRLLDQMILAREADAVRASESY